LRNGSTLSKCLLCTYHVHTSYGVKTGLYGAARNRLFIPAPNR
jgi:hypothetical protein